MTTKLRTIIKTKYNEHNINNNTSMNIKRIVAFCSIVTIFAQASVKNCFEKSECDEEIIRNYTNVTIGGYRGAAKSIIANGNLGKCLGSYSCYRSEEIYCKSNIISQGSLSMNECNNITSVDIFCQGSYDCGDTLMNSLSNGTIYCNGDSSCMNTNIDSANTIFGNGAFSLKNAQISTKNLNLQGHNEMNIYFYGYFAASGTIITCLDGYVCNIHCGDYACVSNMELNCLNNSNCSVNCINGNDDCIVEGNDTYFVNDYTGIVDLDDVSSYIIENNAMCHNGENSVTYDDGTQNSTSIANLYLDTIETNYLCFRGYQSGISSNITINNSNNDIAIRCDAGKACLNSQIDVINSLFFQSTAAFLCSGVSFLVDFLLLRFLWCLFTIVSVCPAISQTKLFVLFKFSQLSPH